MPFDSSDMPVPEELIIQSPWEALAERVGRLEHQIMCLGLDLSNVRSRFYPPSPDRLIAEGPLRTLKHVTEELAVQCEDQVRRYWEDGKAHAMRLSPYVPRPAIDEVVARFRAAGWKVEVEYPKGIVFGTMTFSRADPPA